MTAKTSPARRAAFLRALAETGNQTIAAERAKVSRSWVQLHRSTDPDFRARMDAAIAAAKAQLGEAAERRPPAFWESQAGEELVVKGRGGSGGGRRIQIARARIKQWTPRIEARFLAVLAASCNVKLACAEIGMTAASAYNHRKRWPAFAARWDAAIERGYTELDHALVAGAIALFEPDEALPDSPIPPMSLDQAIRLLGLHRRRARGVGRWPGVR